MTTTQDAERFAPTAALSSVDRSKRLDGAVEMLAAVAKELDTLREAGVRVERNGAIPALGPLHEKIDSLRDSFKAMCPAGAEVALVVYDIHTDTFLFHGDAAHAVRTAARHAMGDTFWQRLRWLMTGR